MRSRSLKVSKRAAADLRRRAKYLGRVRGSEFAQRYVVRLLDRGRTARNCPRSRPALRTFGYEGQATILAYFAEGELEIVRVYFTGQDWSRGPER